MHDKPETGLAPAMRRHFLEELRAVNAVSARFGLTLSEDAMQELAHARTRALIDHGRVELGESAVRAVIEGFCDSPFLLQEDYEETLAELVDAFYYFKNACGDQIADDELILAMRERYDAYDGSVDAVTGTTLEALCRARRLGEEDDGDGDGEDEIDDE
ncbi:MAG: hypothetical protein GX417_05615 [Clostridiales bacterium]|nr:hypothetical protein [Clostridiales bacterium]